MGAGRPSRSEGAVSKALRVTAFIRGVPFLGESTALQVRGLVSEITNSCPSSVTNHLGAHDRGRLRRAGRGRLAVYRALRLRVPRPLGRRAFGGHGWSFRKRSPRTES